MVLFFIGSCRAFPTQPTPGLTPARSSTLAGNLQVCFAQTAQIRFPAGVRRQETGKAVKAQGRPDDFPLHCDEPLAGEDLTYVLYGSGGYSLYDTAR